jgi:hypothetical protein
VLDLVDIFSPIAAFPLSDGAPTCRDSKLLIWFLKKIDTLQKEKNMKDSPSKKTGQKSQVKDSIHVNDDIDCDELKAMADDFVSDSNDDEDDLTALIPNITEHMKNTENLNKCKTTKEQEEKHMDKTYVLFFLHGY